MTRQIREIIRAKLHENYGKLDLRCMGNVRCCDNVCSTSPSKLLLEQHSGFVSSLQLNAEVVNH